MISQHIFVAILNGKSKIATAKMLSKYTVTAFNWGMKRISIVQNSTVRCLNIFFHPIRLTILGGWGGGDGIQCQKRNICQTDVLPSALLFSTTLSGVFSTTLFSWPSFPVAAATPSVVWPPTCVSSMPERKRQLNQIYLSLTTQCR